MALPTVSGLADPPSFGDLANFGTDANAFVGSLPAFLSSVNALVAAMNAMGLGDLDPTDFAVSLLKANTAAQAYAALGAVPAAQIRSDYPADKTFRRGNVIGTVAQSAGVPTGALLEKGSNANGNYLRFADGTQICTAKVAADLTTNNVSSNTWPFPAAFTGDVSVSWGATRSTTGIPGSDQGALSTAFIHTTGTQWSLFSQGGGASSTFAFIALTAIGRWF
ncbi:hypothetical protein [Falsirhodobacter sp. 1013]|uniref:hypothetical protein n=1 Tax=Falsirhodobacter sp. 1013 TaxID=3417566 RepID=UPI003EB92B34